MPSFLKEVTYKEKVPEKAYELTLGPLKKRVAVLGAFDTWSYMHKICTDIAKQGYTAITSRYVYRDIKNKSGYYRTKRERPKKDMNDFLKQDLIGISIKAVIIYSVPAAHYNEAEWCNKENQERDFKTLGMCFVREIQKTNFCSSCVVNEELGYSYCEGIGNAWDCIERADCPFKTQGIAKNQIEYFLNNRDDMILIAIEKLEKTDKIIDLFIHDDFMTPVNYPYVFEFRIMLNEEEMNDLEVKVNELLIQMDERMKTNYKLIDYYFKPEKQLLNGWIVKNRTLRIRESCVPVPIKKDVVNIYSSELIKTDEGYFCEDPFGNLKWFSGENERAIKLLNDYNMEFFIKVIKTGNHYVITRDMLNFQLFIEKIEVEKDNTKSLLYGYSVEIEIWAENTEYTNELKEKKDEILELLGLKELSQNVLPVQEFITKWSKTQQFEAN